MYIKQSLSDAADEVLKVLGSPSPEWNQNSEWARLVRTDVNLESVQYIIDQAIYILRAALDLPVLRQRCPKCNARDSIYYENYPSNPELAPTENPDHFMWCHTCGVLDPPREWVTEIIEVENG